MIITDRQWPRPWPGYTVPEFGGRLNGLSGFTDWAAGVWDLLAGKPQSWYDRIDRDQKAFAARAAEIRAIGQDSWDMVRSSYLDTTQGPNLDFLSFREIQDGITSHLSELVVTKSHVPTDQAISNAEAFNAQYGRYVDYVKSILPELSAQISDAVAQVQQLLSKGSLQSPTTVGRQVLVDELERRISILGAGLGAGLLLYLGIAYLISRAMGGR